MIYTIGQVEEITGVKRHVLRYWEEVIPGFAPKKDFGGRRVYHQRDIEIVLRMKHLVYKKKYTIEGAREQIILESEFALEAYSDEGASRETLLLEIKQVRAELAEVYFLLKKYKAEQKRNVKNSE